MKGGIKMTNSDEIIKTAKWVSFAVLFLTILFGSMYIIDAGERGVLVTLGNPSNAIITEGLHFKVPFIQHVVKFDIKTQKAEVKTSSASKDLQIVYDEISVNYHLRTDVAPTIYKEVGVSYVDRILTPAILEAVKAATAEYTAEELITKREEVKDVMTALLIEKMQSRGIVIDTVLITDFDYSDSFNAAIEAKVTAEQNALAAKNKLAQIEYEAQQEVTAAKGKAEAQRYQIEALQVRGGKEYVQLQAINKWNGFLPTVVAGSDMPFIGSINFGNSSL